jgi:hypothetical protein
MSGRGPYTDADLDIDPQAEARADVRDDARADAAKERPCTNPECYGSGCPACWGDEEDS